MNKSLTPRSFMLPLTEMSQALPKRGLIYEIGCGGGVISNFITQPKRRIIGIDTDATKISLAQKKYNTNKNLQFIASDAITFPYSFCVGVIMSDFLHHIDYQSQEKLLKKVSLKIKRNGILVIKEIDKSDGLLMWCSRIWDFLFYPKDTIYYRTKVQWYTLLQNLKFEVHFERKIHWFPGSTFLFICTKK